MINNFDYGPQYNEQILLESTVMLNRMDSTANDKPSTIVSSVIDPNLMSHIGPLQSTIG